MLPNPFENEIYKSSEKVKSEVLKVNNDNITTSGLIKFGEQACEVMILQGKFKGEIVTGTNILLGSYEKDKIFKEGDFVFTIIDYNSNSEITGVVLYDYYRLNLQLMLAVIFVILLLIFARGIGLRSLLSFAFTILMIWKVLIPMYLKGFSPIMVSSIIVCIITTVIITLIYGTDKRSLAAILGSMSGIIVTAFMALYFVKIFNINGAVMSHSEGLIYTGYQNIDLTSIFISTIFISASGAIMDVAVDITTAVHEISEKRPDLSPMPLIKSGLTLGRAVMGTMCTTLLLAYSGGYMGLLMVFTAQGTPIENILNLNYISAEILHTIIGSCGLITVAPFTAVFSGVLLSKHKESID